MLSRESLAQWAVKWQTTPANVAREYLQHEFLSNLYQAPGSEHVAFKGGTALRIAFQSPRFSEDLDFSANLKPFHLQRLLSHALDQMAQAGLEAKTMESKPTSGGFLALYAFELNGETVRIELNVSTRSRVHAEPILIATPLVPSYQCMILPTDRLVEEKIQALLTRHKARDFFDLYFLLRNRLGIAPIVRMKGRLLEAVERLEARDAQRELRVFLPVSHQRVASDISQVLLAELRRL